MDYYYKYLKYKQKYINLKNLIELNQSGGNNDTSLSKSNINFTINLFKNLTGNSNIVSPFSLEFALEILHLAAIGNTDTQLTNLFGHKYSIDELEYYNKLFNNDIMKINNAFIINDKIVLNKKYLDTIRDLVLISNNNFSNPELVAQTVNNFIENKTNHLIKNVISTNDIDSSTVFVLVNTIYFKADWKHKFNKKYTSKMPFNNNKNNLVNMMHQTNYFNYYKNKVQEIN